MEGKKKGKNGFLQGHGLGFGGGGQMLLIPSLFFPL